MDKSLFEPHHIGAVTIQQIRCFAAVAERKAYRGLAKELGIEQPAVSRAVMRLEEILGARLFEPGERTRMTAFGQKVYREAGRILGMVESLKRLALDEAGKGRVAGVVTIGTKSIFAETLLPKLIARFRGKHRRPFATSMSLGGTSPIHGGRASIRVRCGSGESLLQMLRSGEIDIALSHSRPCPAGIAFRRMWSFPRLLVTPKGHPLGKGKITAGKLADAGLILPGKHTRTHAEMMEHLSRVIPAERLQSFIEVTSAEAQIRYVAVGLGVTIVDGSARDLIPAALAARPVPASLLSERAAGIYYSTERYTSQAVIKFMETACGFNPNFKERE